MIRRFGIYNAGIIHILTILKLHKFPYKEYIKKAQGVFEKVLIFFN